MDTRKTGWEVEVLWAGSTQTVAKRWSASKSSCEIIYRKSVGNPDVVIECNVYHDGKRVQHWNRNKANAL